MAFLLMQMHLKFCKKNLDLTRKRHIKCLALQLLSLDLLT